jgi:hypothetical protein
MVVLSEEFWREIQEHPIPVDLDMIRVLADSPGNLDLYVWLVWRCWTARDLAKVPLFGPIGLISQLGVSGHLRERDFRRQIAHWVKRLKQLWPECPAILDKPGTYLLIRPTKPAKSSTVAREFESGVHVTEFAHNT